MKRFAFVLALAACVSGPPPNWSRAQVWTFPLFAPEDGAATVLGTIDGHGPYVWFIDTGSAYTTIDPRVAAELHLHAVASGRWHDLSDEHRHWLGKVSDGQVREWKVGDLTVNNPSFTVAQIDVASWKGHPVAGYLGMDTIRYMTLEVDFDGGVARLGMPGQVHFPDGIVAAPAYVRDGQLFAEVRIGGQARSFKIRSAAGVSTLFPASAKKLGIAGSGKQGRLPTYGGPKAVETYEIPAVAVGGTERANVELVEQPIANEDDSYGSLGGDFLRNYHWYIDVQGGRMALLPRTRREQTVARRREAIVPLATQAEPASCASGQATISGVVRHTSGKPLAHVNVVAQQSEGASRADVTDAQGRFRICVEPGTYTVWALWQRPGEKQMPVFERRALTAPADQETTIDPELDERCAQPRRGLMCATVKD